MAQTWYDDGGVPREEWGSKPQATHEDVKAAKEGLQKYFEREARKQESFYDGKRDEVRNSAATYEDRLAAINRSKEMAAQEVERQAYQYKQEQKLREERKQHREAVNAARKRYEEKSGLYRLFHKRLSVKRAASMTTEEVNNLYGGIEEAKGMSR